MGIVDKILNNEELTEDEIQEIVWDDICDERIISTEKEMLDANRWNISCSILIKIQLDNEIKAYKIFYCAAATEMQEDCYWSQVAEEVFPVQVIKYMTKEEIEEMREE